MEIIFCQENPNTKIIVWKNRPKPKDMAIRILLKDKKTATKLLNLAKRIGIKTSCSTNKVANYLHFNSINDVTAIRLSGERILQIEEFVVYDTDSELIKMYG